NTTWCETLAMKARSGTKTAGTVQVFGYFEPQIKVCSQNVEDVMEAIISDMLNRFEKGVLTRRGLIQGLTMLASAGGAASQAQTPAPATKAAKIDHMSI